MGNLIQVQDALIATLVKCYRTNIRKGATRAGMARKCPAIRVAENKVERAIAAMGFTDQQAYRAMLDARDMAILEVECGDKS